MNSFTHMGRTKMTDDEIGKILCNSEEFPYDSTDESSDDEGEISKICSTKNRSVLLIDKNIDSEEETELSFDLNNSVHDSFIALMNDDNKSTTPVLSPIIASCSATTFTKTSTPISSLRKIPSLKSKCPTTNLVISNTPVSSQMTSPVSKESSQLIPGPSLSPEHSLDYLPSTSTFNLFPSKFQNINVDPKSSAFEKIIWKQGNLQFHSQEVEFRGDSSLPEEIQSLVTPYQVWSYLFPERLENLIVEETLRYAGLDEKFSFSNTELRKFIGITFYMTYFNLPNTRDYWSSSNDRSVDVIKNQMTVNQFEKIRQYIHFNDKEKRPSRNDPTCDRLYLIRPVIDSLNCTFGSIPKMAKLSVDEQMCSTKMNSYMRQYLPNKPKKWGFKFFVLCDTKGYAYKFEIYTGSNEILRSEEPNLQASANIVVRLVREVPRFKNYIIYFDNYYTTIPLVIYLRTLGILSVGTIRRNRIKNCKFPEEKIMMKCERGTSREFVASVYGIDVTSISWKDTKLVNLVSTYIGTKPAFSSIVPNENESVRRFDKKQNKVTMVACPQIVKDYNKNMGGVDLLDSSMSRHKITLKSRKWTNRIFYHLLDMTCINAWILYNRINQPQAGIKNLRLIDFKLEVADSLFKYKNSSKDVSFRRRSNLETEIQKKKRKPNSQIPPPKDVRLDGTQHWIMVSKKGRCKMPGCTGQTKMFCRKCELNLCLTTEKNCFYNYHNQ